MLVVGKILAGILLPPGLFALVMALAILLSIKGKRRACAIALAIGILLLYALSTNTGASLLARPLEDAYPPLSETGDANAIVVLGGGYLEDSPERGNSGALEAISTKRAAYGLELSRRFGLPLVYSGGHSYDSSRAGSEAEAAGLFWKSLGAPEGSFRLEKESQDTKANAAGVRRLAGSGPIVLVTSAVHMPRALLAFSKAGIRAIAAPTDYIAKRTPLGLSDFLPSGAGLMDCSFALHEYVGYLYYWLT